MSSHTRREPLIDASWQRVESFDEAGPSRTRRRSLDAQGNSAMAAGTVEGEPLVDDEDEDDGEWQYEDEEELITLDLGPESKRLVQMSQECSITGLDSAHPFVQLGNLMFKGTWDQLIGTEIILHDRRDASRPQGLQHTLWPLSATATDRRLQRPPSSTRRRITLRQAANMAAKEAALVRADDVHPPLLHVHAPVLKETKTGLVTYKGWVWVRGRGWMRKEDAAVLQRGREDAATAAAGSVKLSPDTAAERQLMDVDDEADEQPADQADEDAGTNAKDGENEEQGQDGAEREAGVQLPTERPSEDLQQPKGNLGRRKMTQEESIRYKLWRAMRKVELKRQGEAESDDE